MSAASSLSGLACRPGRPNDRPGAAVTDPHRALTIALLLRQVINYAKELLVTVRLRAGAPDFARFTRPFGTSDVRLIIDRIASAIRYAAILEDDLLKVARLGRHMFTKPSMPSDPARAPREPRPSGAQAESAARHAEQPKYRVLDRLPSAAQIAAEIRRRPVGEVVAVICRDLGITPNHKLWPALSEVVAAHGGHLEELLQEIEERCPPEYWPPAPDPDAPGSEQPAIMLRASDLFAAADRMRQRRAATGPP